MPVIRAEFAGPGHGGEHAEAMRQRDEGRFGTFYVLEEDPPSARPRWYCHWDGDDAPGFESVEEAVAWGVKRARGVVIRTVRTIFYLAGERPDDWSDDTELRAWPPSVTERRQIDADYEAAVAAAMASEAAWREYETGRDDWLQAHGIDPAHQPLHQCTVHRQTSDEVVVFEEFDLDGEVCGATARDGRRAFGSPIDVLGYVTGLGAHDPWVRAVVDALDRDRDWQDGRRGSLEVYLGAGEMFHVSASANRESIERHVLDWRQMRDNAGVAGSGEPELQAIFLCESDGDVRFFIDMARLPSDVWAVDVTGRWIENGPDGWVIVSEPLPADAVRLVQCDVNSSRRW